MCVLVHILFFFFKQKTAYEMRISDWSSDVCSSDLVQLADTTPHVALLYGADPDGDRRHESMQAVMPGIHAHKIDAVRRNIPLADGDPLLLEAYQHKIVKEQAAASFVI